VSPVPDVAVVVTTRNRASYLRQCLRSVLGQSLPPSRVVVADDASTDATAQVVAEARAEAGRRGVEVVYLRHRAPRGQEANRREALREAGGQLVTLLDDDDTLAPGFLAATVPVLAARPDLAFVATQVVWTREDGTPWAAGTRRAMRRFGRVGLREGVCRDVLARQLARKTFFLLGVLFRQAWLRRIGYVPEGSGAVCDFAIFCALGAQAAPGYYLPQPLAHYRIHPGQQTNVWLANSWDSRRWGYRLLERLPGSPGCGPRERRLADQYTIRAHRELAIALAHAGSRAEAVEQARDLIRRWGMRALSVRLLVLAALLAGVRAGRGAGPAV
jgi:glycosyltransferase involved in cell wall biosynthesis